MVLSMNSIFEDNQITALEAGFEGKLSAKILSSRFFFLAILFVLFDIELILIFPIILINTKTLLYGMLSALILLSVITLTLLLE
jgi:NADH:ubiquinone oxidoreductase subunit 3 (subunit A)